MVALPFCFKPFKASDEGNESMMKTLVSEAREKFIECVQMGMDEARPLEVVKIQRKTLVSDIAFGVDSLEDIGSRLMSSALRK